MDEYFALTRLTVVTILLMMGATAATAADRKSREKCKEYGKLVYSEEASPVLRIDAGGKKERVSKCGIVHSPLIIGGVVAEPFEFPHMAVIGFGKDPISWMCGGSVISENFILTAAHCLEATDKGAASKIRAGLTDLKKPDAAFFQERNILKRIAHPEYKVPSRYHDIALLKLDKPLQLGPKLRPACLDVEPSPPGGSSGKAIATGFGRTSSDSPTGSDRLMKVTLDYVSNADCKKNFAAETGGRRMSQGLLVPNMLCAGFAAGGKDTCQGDSGGPLQRVLEDPYCTYSVVGVTSFGKFCAQKNSPAIYTRVSSYVDWIESVVWP